MERAELTKLLNATDCAERAGDFVFLCDPKWAQTERKKVNALKAAAKKKVRAVKSGWLCIPTGGTSGAIRFARHDEQTLTAAVYGFCDHFKLERVNAVDVLPSFHVSGLMARVRCAMTGGKHLVWSWKKLEAGVLPKLGKSAEEGWVISLVPTQLQRLLTLKATREWLQRFEVIFVGGGPVWPALLKTAAACNLRLSLSYGMTETAAMVAASLPGTPLVDGSGGLPTMPHARISILDQQSGAAVPPGREGLIAIRAGSLFRGYFGEKNAGDSFATADLGMFDPHGGLHVLGRRDAVIITGGEKVSPLEVESALRATGGFTDVAVVGVPDPQWGQRVVACYPEKQATPLFDVIRRALHISLATHKHPKHYFKIPKWPVNDQGKVNRVALLSAVASAGLNPSA